MLFSEAVAEVISITGRPDKSTDIASQLNRALSFFTLKAEFSQDLVETSLAIDPDLYGDTVSLASLTRFRKFKYLRPLAQRYYLRSIDPTQIFTPGQQIQRDRYYVGGTSITYTLSQLDSSLEIGYFTYAPVLTSTSGSDAHWMLNLMPYALVEKAAAKIFQLIGDDASFRFYEASAMELFVTGRKDFQDQTSQEAF